MKITAYMRENFHHHLEERLLALLIKDESFISIFLLISVLAVFQQLKTF